MANIEIGGRLHSTATGNIVTGANEVLDDTKNKKQSVINAEVDETIGDDDTEGTIKGRIKAAEGKLDILNGDSSTSGSVAKSVDDAKTELIGGATSDGNTLKKVEDRTATLETAVGSNGSVDQRIAAAKSEVIGDAASDYNTLGKLEDKIQAEASARESAVSTEAQARQDAITAETNRATTRENQIYDLVHTPEQHYVTVATYADLANISSPSDDTVYRVSSYNGKTSQVDNTVYSEYGYDGTNFVFLCVKSQIDEVYDISAHHSNNMYVDLAAALDGGNNIPQELRRGGMSVKFVQSSDNKYVQCRLMADGWSTDIKDWAIADEGVYVENPEFIYVKTDAEGKILFGIKMDGEPFFGVGCPEQVKQYIEEKLPLDELIAYIQAQLATKVDKVEGKGLSSNDYDNTAKSIVDMHEEVEDSEWLQKTIDSEDSFVEGIKSNGTKVLNLDVELPSVLLKKNDDSQYIFLIKDGNDNYLAGIKDNGQIDYFGDTPDKTKAFVKEYVENIEALKTANPYNQNKHQIQNVYSAARYKANKEKCLQLLFVADSHGYHIGLDRALEVNNNLPSVDAFVHLGDIAPWTARQTNYGRNPNELEDAVSSMLSKSIKPVYLVCGNHDVGASRYVYYTYTHEEIYNKMIKPMIDKGYLVSGEYNVSGDWADRCYYFHDFHHVKARLIVLYEYGMQLALDDNEYWEPVVYNSNYDFITPGTTYTYDENNPIILNCGGWKENSFKLRKTVTTTTNPETDKRGGTFPWYKLRNLQLFEKNQMDWLIDRLNDTPDGYGVIIASHQGLMYPVITTDNNFSIGSNPENTYHPRNATIANPTGVEPDVYTNVPIVSKIVGAWINKGQLSERVASRDVLHSSGQNGAYRNTEVDGSGYYMYKIEYDFSERTNNNAYFVGFVGGHEHCDIVERSVEFPNQVSVTVTTSEPSQRYMSDTANDSDVSSPSYDCITIYSCGNNRIALCKWGNAQTIAGKDRSIEIINPINN